MLPVTLRLLERSVNFRKCRVTLLGVSAGDFVQEAERPIASYFGKRKQDDVEKLNVSEKRPKSGQTDDGMRLSECPPDWDEDVFLALPRDMQKELLENRAATTTTRVASLQKPVVQKKNSILNYFEKAKK